MELGLIGNNSWEQIRKEQDVKITKETLDRMYRCKGGFHRILKFMDIHISNWLWIKALYLSTSGQKINLNNTKKLQNNNIMKSWK
jgi:hypothetical protein